MIVLQTFFSNPMAHLAFLSAPCYVPCAPVGPPCLTGLSLFSCAGADFSSVHVFLRHPQRPCSPSVRFGVCASLECATALSRLSHCRGAAGGLVACRGLPGWALVQGDRAGMQRFLPRVPKSSISLTHCLPLSLTASFQGARRPRGRRTAGFTARCPPVRKGKSPRCAGRGGDRGSSCPCTDFRPVLQRAAPARRPASADTTSSCGPKARS